MSSWDEAREFCARMNSTLPIITNEDADNVFQQFIASDSNNVIQNGPVWIDAHALPSNKFVEWYWINGRPSGLRYSVAFTRSVVRLCK